MKCDSSDENLSLTAPFLHAQVKDLHHQKSVPVEFPTTKISYECDFTDTFRPTVSHFCSTRRVYSLRSNVLFAVSELSKNIHRFISRDLFSLYSEIVSEADRGVYETSGQNASEKCNCGIKILQIS